MMKTPDNSGLTRRDALRIMGAGIALASLGLPARGAGAVAHVAPALGWELPPLSYDYAALEPHFDARTMEIHHTKHHQAYLTNAKNLLKEHPDLFARGPEALVRDLGSLPENLRSGVRDQVGGHVNHSFFWPLLAPDVGASVGQLPVAIAGAFGSMDEFKKQFEAAALKRFGSGWVWLSATSDGNLIIHSTANQDSPLSEALKPVIGLDVWEHAYYLHYQNRRADYIGAFWKVLNWTRAEVNYCRAIRG